MKCKCCKAGETATKICECKCHPWNDSEEIKKEKLEYEAMLQDDADREETEKNSKGESLLLPKIRGLGPTMVKGIGRLICYNGVSSVSR